MPHMPKASRVTGEMVIAACEKLAAAGASVSQKSVREELIRTHGVGGSYTDIAEPLREWKQRKAGIPPAENPRVKHAQQLLEQTESAIRKDYSAQIEQLKTELNAAMAANDQVNEERDAGAAALSAAQLRITELQAAVQTAKEALALAEGTASHLATTSDQVVAVDRRVAETREAIGAVGDQLSGALAKVTTGLTALAADLQAVISAQASLSHSIEAQQTIIMAALPAYAENLELLAKRTLSIDEGQHEASIRMLERLNALEHRQAESDRRASQRHDRLAAQLAALHRRLPRE